LHPADSFEVVVKGGSVATADAQFDADIGISGGAIAAIAPDLPARGAQVIDATGQLVIPGGIDVHTHFATRIGEAVTADDFESGSRAAAAGGLTCFINFAFQEQGDSLRHAIERELAKAQPAAHVDFGLHLGLVDPRVPGVLEEIDGLAADGFPSIKMFTTIPGMELDDRATLALLRAAARAKCIVNVHAEDGGLVEHLTRRLLAEGHTGVEFLTHARPPAAEAIATARVAEYARVTGCPVYFVHLSCADALDAVRQARSRGAQIYVETRPAYLFLDDSCYRLPERAGNKFVTWPPLRDKSDQAALWHGLRTGEIQTYATDHTTWTLAQKMAPGLTFDDIPGGVANVQTSVGMLYNEGVRQDRLSLSQFVAVTSTNAAKLFGLWPRKGTIAVGSDADLCVVDPRESFHVTASAMQSRSDFDPYEDYDATGWPVVTMSRGKVVYDHGKVVSRPGQGRLIKRARFAGL
jgi:dihydropyrimidinase